MNFFYKESRSKYFFTKNLNKKKYFFFQGVGRGGWGTRVVIFFAKNPNLKTKLDYQVSMICSLIPPATAISKTQNRVDTSVCTMCYGHWNVP